MPMPELTFVRSSARSFGDEPLRSARALARASIAAPKGATTLPKASLTVEQSSTGPHKPERNRGPQTALLAGVEKRRNTPKKPAKIDCQAPINSKLPATSTIQTTSPQTKSAE